MVVGQVTVHDVEAPLGDKPAQSADIGQNSAKTQARQEAEALDERDFSLSQSPPEAMALDAGELDVMAEAPLGGGEGCRRFGGAGPAMAAGKVEDSQYAALRRQISFFRLPGIALHRSRRYSRCRRP